MDSQDGVVRTERSLGTIGSEGEPVGPASLGREKCQKVRDGCGEKSSESGLDEFEHFGWIEMGERAEPGAGIVVDSQRRLEDRIDISVRVLDEVERSIINQVREESCLEEGVGIRQREKVRIAVDICNGEIEGRKRLRSARVHSEPCAGIIAPTTEIHSRVALDRYAVSRVRLSEVIHSDAVSVLLQEPALDRDEVNGRGRVPRFHLSVEPSEAVCAAPEVFVVVVEPVLVHRCND
ncbi:hypothetical protein [Lacisediminihabitans sp.]|jgi:hypothetical protein|uniref:hypothetical protein n=1 Tax=Lacisediminihabitans sp. TaxID=2787631 RepID=UPI002F94FEDA